MTGSKTRTQRRMERKQALTLLVLVLVVSLSSFTLGVIVGRRGAERDMAQSYPEPRRIMVADVPQKQPVATPANEAESTPAEEEKLTFYDNLSRGETVPLGSGINLPPEEKPAETPKPQPKTTEPVAAPAPKSVTVAKKVVESPVQRPLPVAPKTAPANIPPADAGGTYSVQVGAFSSVADAGRLKKSLIKKGYPAFIAEADLGPKGLWYRVRLGPYADSDTAKEALTVADQKDKIKGFITRL